VSGTLIFTSTLTPVLFNASNAPELFRIWLDRINDEASDLGRLTPERLTSRLVGASVDTVGMFSTAWSLAVTDPERVTAIRK